MTTNASTDLPRGVLTLGLAGLLPFLAALAWGIAIPGQRAMAASVFVAYGASILSFLGGTRWGLGLSRADTGVWWFVEAVAPSLVALSALVLVHQTSLALALLGFGFALWAVLDIRDARWPEAYRRMRLGITLAVLVLHGAWALLLA